MVTLSYGTLLCTYLQIDLMNMGVTGAYAAAAADVVEAVDVDREKSAPATQLRLEIGAKVIPHPDKVWNGLTALACTAQSCDVCSQEKLIHPLTG